MGTFASSDWTALDVLCAVCSMESNDVSDVFRRLWFALWPSSTHRLQSSDSPIPVRPFGQGRD